MATNLTQRGRTGNNPALLPALPASTATDPVRRQWEEMVREWLEVRLGARGDFFERAVTHRELRQQLDELALNQGQSAEERRLRGLISALQGQVVALARQFNVVQSLLTTNVDNSTGAITNIIKQVDGVANEDVSVFAVDMRPTQTGGCSAITTVEFGVNQPNFHALMFDPTTSESADFHTMLPFGWAGKAFKVYVYWGHGTGAATFGVTWEITANSTYDNETVILDFVGGAVVTDVGGVGGNLYIAESAAVPIASFENEEGSLVSIRIYRRPSHASDTLTIDAALLAVRFALVDIALISGGFDPSWTAGFYAYSRNNTALLKVSSGYRSALSLVTRSTGKRYVAAKITAEATPDECIIGLVTIGSDVNGWPGRFPGDFGCQFARIAGVGVWASWVFSALGSSTICGVNDTAMMAVDFDAGKIWYGRNGTWYNSGNPATGANPSQTFAPNTPMHLGAADNYVGNAQTYYFTGGSSYAPPSGFSYWDL